MRRDLDEDLVRRKLAAYVAVSVSLPAFHTWLVLATADLEEWAPDELKALVNRIKLRLAEYSNGHWTKAELKDQLAPLVNIWSTSFLPGEHPLSVLKQLPTPPEAGMFNFFPSSRGFAWVGPLLSAPGARSLEVPAQTAFR